jgi:hypothetical protein
MSNWSILFSEIVNGLDDVVMVGEKIDSFRKKMHENYLPFAVTLGAKEKSDLALFEGREAKDDQTMIYVCRNKTCHLPVDNVEAATQQIISR